MRQFTELSTKYIKEYATAVNKWSEGVTQEETFHSKAGIFKKPAADIAKYFLKVSSSPGRAVRRIVFYKNRAGKNLSPQQLQALNKAIKIVKSKEIGK